MDEMTGVDCYHFQRSADAWTRERTPSPWRPGETYDVGHSFNRYFDFFYRRVQTHRLPRSRSSRPLAHAAHVLDTTDQDTRQHRRRPRYAYEEALETLRSTTAALQAQCNLVRELVFEEVRKQYFPGCPSRHQCVWLAPSEASMHFWDRRGPRRKTWFRVRLLAGRFHLADATLVRAEYQSVAELRELAHRYWRGLIDPGRAETELLFVGRLEVLKSLPAGSPLAG